MSQFTILRADFIVTVFVTLVSTVRVKLVTFQAYTDVIISVLPDVVIWYSEKIASFQHFVLY